MTSRLEYCLVDAEFNDFLFAFVGEEESGVDLTVLSALARLGLDPWGEAANLSKLSREAATSALAEKIAALPKGLWKEADIGSIALRLVNYLPKNSSVSAKSLQDRGIGGHKPRPETQKWLIWAVLAGAMCMALSRLFAD
jgi:hypothetical protein